MPANQQGTSPCLLQTDQAQTHQAPLRMDGARSACMFQDCHILLSRNCPHRSLEATCGSIQKGCAGSLHGLCCGGWSLPGGLLKGTQCFRVAMVQEIVLNDRMAQALLGVHTAASFQVCHWHPCNRLARYLEEEEGWVLRDEPCGWAWHVRVPHTCGRVLLSGTVGSSLCMIKGGGGNLCTADSCCKRCRCTRASRSNTNGLAPKFASTCSFRLHTP